MFNMILRSSLRVLCPLMVYYSVYLLIRGHNEPGGGFVGVLVAALAVVLWMFTESSRKLLLKLNTAFPYAVALGGLVVLTAASAPLLMGRPILTGLWSSKKVMLVGKLSTVLLFDLGVFLVVAFCTVGMFSRLLGRIKVRI